MNKFIGALICALFIALPNSAHGMGDTKSVNLYINPIGALFDGVFSGGVDIALGQKVTLGPVASFFNVTRSGVNVTATAYGGRFNYYFDGAIKSSWRFSLIAEEVPMKLSQGGFGATVNATEIAALIGYHWVWSVLNLGLGAGAYYYTANSGVTLTDPNGSTTNVNTPLFHGIVPGIEFTLGIGF
jgi:hypothetical protein